MVDPVTPNTGLAVPIRGSDVGTWDTPVNGDFTLIDSMLGGVTTVALSSTSVTLAASQAQNSIIRLTGSLLANVTITLPSIYKFWTIDNQLTNSPTTFGVSLVSTSGTNQIGLPPGTQDVFYDGTTVNYRNLGRIGEYWDYAANAVPAWVNLSTKPPYLYCNGTAFSSASYPILANLLGTAVLPDGRGRSRAAFNDGTARLNAANGVDGNTVLAGGGGDTAALTSPTQLPAHNHTINEGAGHQHLQSGFTGTTAATFNISGLSGGVVPNVVYQGSAGLTNTGLSATGLVINNTGSGVGHPNVQPTYIGGITLIRAA